MKNFFIFLVLVILVTGCAELVEKIPKSLPGLGSSDDIVSTLLGPSGVVSMEIYYPQEKGQVVQDLPFSPTIKISNTGSSDSRGQVCINPLDSDAFGKTGCDCLTYAFEKLPDEKFKTEVLSFGPYAINPSADLARSFEVTALNRYTYSSQSYFKPCIRKVDSLGKCAITAPQTANGPVIIESIEEIIAPSGANFVQMALNVKIKKSSTGDLISEEDVDNLKCSIKILDAHNKPKIKGVIEGLPFIGTVNCKDATLDDDGRGLMQCVIGQVDLFDEKGHYRFSEGIQTPAKLTLMYAYETIDSNGFTVGGTRFT